MHQRDDLPAEVEELAAAGVLELLPGHLFHTVDQPQRHREGLLAAQIEQDHCLVIRGRTEHMGRGAIQLAKTQPP